MNAEKILTEVYWDLSSLSDDQIKYPDHDILRKCLKKYLNSRYGTIIAKEGKMAGFLNEQVQEWYKNNTDLLGVIDKLTKRCEKLEEENTHLKDEVKAALSGEEIARWNLENRTHEVIELDRCLDEKNARIKALKQKLTAIFTSLGVDDTRPALDKIMEMKKLIKQNEEENNQLRKKVEDLQASYDNCVNECADYVIEIDSLLQNLEVETVEQGIEKIKVLKDGCLITFNFSAEADLRVENEKLKKKIEDLRKDVKFEFDRRMTELAASTELKETVGRLRQKNYDLSRVLQEESIGRKRAESENAKLKSFIKDRTKYLHDMTEAIEKHLAELREEKNNE